MEINIEFFVSEIMTKDYKIFIGNIPFDCRESDIHHFFRGYGRIRQVVLKNNYGFCEFLDYGDAKAAVRDLNGERLLGVRVTVEMARGEMLRQDGAAIDPEARAAERFCIYLGRLPEDITEMEVDRFFNGYGRMMLILMRKGYSYVFIQERQDAEIAVKELQGRKVRGEKIILEFLEKGENNNLYKFPRYQLKVENMSQNTASQELRDYMKQAGEIVECVAHASVKGEGVVEFAKWKDLKWALENFHDTKLCGRNLRLSEIVD